MAAKIPLGRGVRGLIDRDPERTELDRFLTAVRAARSQVLVLRGERGVGKTALLRYVASCADGCLLLQVAGVQSEMKSAYAALRRMCEPILHRVDQLPAPQRDALKIAFDLGVGPPPDRLIVDLAVLTLLSEVAAERPLVCLIDDEHWLDHASAQTLGFVARRLADDPVGLVFAGRVRSAHLSGLRTLTIEGLSPEHAQSLLDTALSVPLDSQVRDLLVAEARGNPQALLDLPRSMTPAHLAGGFGLPLATPVSGHIEEGFRQRLDALPDATRRLLQLVAADVSGDPVLVYRAADRMGIPIRAAEPAVDAGLVTFGGRVHFLHPSVRSAAYRSAPAYARQELHGVLADLSDPVTDPDRRAWHRAHAVEGPNEDVAAELERSAERAQGRGGLAAVAAFLERSVHLTDEPARRARRALAAAQATMAAGAFDRALVLVGMAESGAPDELVAARADLVRAQIAFFSGLGNEAPALLLKAADRLQPLDLTLARETYLNAWIAALFAGRMVGAGSMEDVSRAVRALPPTADPRPADLLLDGLVLLFTEDSEAAAPALRRAARHFAEGGVTREEGLGFGWMAAVLVWDADAAYAIQERNARLSRAVGALGQLPIALVALAMFEAWRGDFATAETQIAEVERVCGITESYIAPFAAMFLAALRGEEAEMRTLVEASLAVATSGGQGSAITYASWTTAILGNGRGDHAAAFTAARRATDDGHLIVSMWALPELVEAAVRVREFRVASHAVQMLMRSARRGGTDFGLGIEARSRALLGGPDAERLYREAIDRLNRAGIRTELARAHLVYGEWLLREGRVTDARSRLRTAHEMLGGLGMKAFAERARRELPNLGQTVRKRTGKPATALTPKEARVARLAADGMNNGEIAAHLVLSTRTVEWHLSKVFSKLGISSRRELGQALSALQRNPGR